MLGEVQSAKKYAFNAGVRKMDEYSCLCAGKTALKKSK